MNIQEALSAIRRFEPELIALRRDLHAHPELGFEEFRTSAIVAERLRSWGLEVHDGIAGTGVVATLRGRRPGNRSIALRADMDALRIHEKTGLPYRSTSPGRMHACGHDGHTAMLLAAARHLASVPDFAGTVHFVFQPAEEGVGGAARMIAEGLFERFPADAVFAMHNQPGRPAGTFGIRKGPLMAAADKWSAAFVGAGGHGGNAAHLSIDPTVPGAAFISALQTIVSRNVPALQSAVVSIGYVAAGEAGTHNVIPTRFMVGGTARSYAPEVRDLIERRLAEIARAAAAIQNCQVEVEYHRGPPTVVNASGPTDIAAAAAAALVGRENVDTQMTPMMAGEDFAFMLEERPGALIWIGNGHGEDGSFHDLHTARYDFNDEIVALGAAYWVSLVGTALADMA